MMQKRLLIPSRVRRIPRQFSWVDHRLVREYHIELCDPPALALYLFLITVADAQGLSYYADGSISQLLSLAPGPLTQARQTLVQAGLIAYEAPLYQVLALDPPEEVIKPTAPSKPTDPSSRAQAVGELRSLRELLRPFPGASS